MSSISSQKTEKTSWLLAWAVLFVAGSAGWLIALFAGHDAARAWRALLINFIYFTPIAAALVTWSAIVVCSNGRWPGGSERLSWSGFGFLIPTFLILIVLWLGSQEWAPWYGRTDLKQGLWLNNSILFSRELLALALFWGCAYWYLQRRSKGRRIAWTSGGLLIAVYGFVFSLFGFDMVAALNPEWHSAAFGAYLFISSLYGAVLVWGLMVVFRPEYGPDLRHDFGKLMLAFGILTTYFMFIQLLPIWYENLPEETSYVIHRKNYFDWKIVSSLVVGVVYLGPLIMLLTTRVKRNRYTLGAVAVLLLAGLWLERWWMVAPTFAREPVLGLPELSAAAATLGLLGLGMLLSQKFLPEAPSESEQEVPGTEQA